MQVLEAPRSLYFSDVHHLSSSQNRWVLGIRSGSGKLFENDNAYSTLLFHILLHLHLLRNAPIHRVALLNMSTQ